MRTGDFEHLCSSFDPLRKVAENSSCRGLTQISKGIFERTGVLRFLNATAPHIACLGPVYKSTEDSRLSAPVTSCLLETPARVASSDRMRPLASRRASRASGKIHNVEILGHKGKVKRTQTEAGLKVALA